MVEGPPDIQAVRSPGKSFVLHIERVIRHWRGSYWLSSGFFTLATKMTTVAFGFLNFLILIRVLSPADYGAWVLFISVSTLMELVKHGFIRNPLIRYLSITPPEEQSSLQSASLFLNTIIAVLQGAVLVAFAYTLTSFWDVPQLHSLFLIYILTTFAYVPANHFDTVQQAGLQFMQLFFVNLVKQGGLFLYVVTSFMVGSRITLEGCAIAQFGGAVASCLLSYIFVKGLLSFSPRLSSKWVGELYHYGKFTFGTNVSSMIIKNMSTWLLGRMVSVNAVTIFNPAVRVSNLVEVPNDTLSAIYFPRVSRDFAESGIKAVKRRYEMAVGALLAMVIPGALLMMLLAPQVILLLAGPGFEETIPILRLIMLYCMLLPFNRFFGVTLDAIGKARVNFRMVMLTAVLNLGTCLLFIHFFGTIGAAYGTLLTYFVTFVANQIYLRRRFGIRLQGVFVEMFNFYRTLPSRLNGRPG
jgi:O-antigen/teichoic acid export membrane protein